MSIIADDVVRDRINLYRIVRRLEQNILEKKTDASSDNLTTWLKSRSNLQVCKVTSCCTRLATEALLDDPLCKNAAGELKVTQ